MLKKLLALTFIFLLLSSEIAWADSLWQSTSASPYTTQKAFKIGDIITILIMEATTAAQKAGTRTGVKDELGLRFEHTIDRLTPYIGTRERIYGLGENKYTGSGQTTRMSNVQAKIAAGVIDVLPNGNLKIYGRHRVTVNEETQEIAIYGIVRPKDVSLANTIYSYQVANAEISVQGKGVVGESSAPGFFTRIINWLF